MGCLIADLVFVSAGFVSCTRFLTRCPAAVQAEPA